MENQLFQLKFTAKQLQRMATKSIKQEKAALAKVKKMMEAGDGESARIYAQNAIRAKTTCNSYLRLSSRVESVASRLESAAMMQRVSKQMGGVAKTMDKALASMDLTQIAKVMDHFEASFDEVGQRAGIVESALAGATASTMPVDEVDALVAQVADEHGMEFAASAASASTAPVAQRAGTHAVEQAEEDSLEQRLQALRG